MTDGKKIGHAVIRAVFQVILEKIVLLLSRLRLKEACHVVDDDQNKRKRLPLDGIGKAAHFQSGKQLFPLLNDLVNQPEKLRALLRVVLLENRPAVGQIPENLEQPARIIQRIELKLLRRRFFHQGIKKCLHERGFSASRLPAHENVAAGFQIQKERVLLLLRRIVQFSDIGGQRTLRKLLFLLRRNLIRQHRKPQGLRAYALLLCRLHNAFHERNELRSSGGISGHFRLHRQNRRTHIVDDLNALVLLLHDLILGLVFCAAPGRLAHGEIFIISHLQIEAAGFPEFCCLRPFQHIHTVRPVLHFEADPEFCVAQDLICHHACRFLGCQNQMDAQASADAGDAHQLVQEIRLLLFQLRKLIRDDKKMRHRLFHNA